MNITRRDHPRCGDDDKRRGDRRQRWAWGYVLALGVLWLVFTQVGERWWPVAYLLYVPRAVWALPLLVIVAPLGGQAWWTGLARNLRSNLVPLGAATVMLLVPIGRFRWALAATEGGGGEQKGEHQLRLLVQNVHQFPAIEPFLAEVSRLRPDVVMLQEAAGRPAGWWQRAVPEYQWRQAGEHLLGSRFPVVLVVDRWRTGYVRYEVMVDGEKLSLFSLHPPSPQFAVKHVLGAPTEGEPREWSRMGKLAILDHDMRRRMNALAAVRAELASTRMAIVGGDTNITDGGRALGEYLGALTDAFEVVGRGFGHTFPASAPWLRLDRLMVSQPLRVLALTYTNAVASDHCGLVVDVAW